jgi:hypothetical protein
VLFEENADALPASDATNGFAEQARDRNLLDFVDEGRRLGLQVGVRSETGLAAGRRSVLNCRRRRVGKRTTGPDMVSTSPEGGSVPNRLWTGGREIVPTSALSHREHAFVALSGAMPSENAAP